MTFKNVLSAFALIAVAACGGSSSEISVAMDDVLFESVALDSGPVDALATGNDDTDFEGILNDLRISRGDETLSWDPRLNAAAQKYAVEQSNISGLSHTGVNGSTVYDRIVAEGYDPIGWAENLAKGYQSEDAVLQAWIDSPGHNANLNADLEDYALGVAGSGSRLSWVLVLATER